MQIPLLSFFTGGGFLDIGFELAGFNIAWTNEIKPAFADMYRSGITSWRASRNEHNIETKTVSSCASIEDLQAPQVVEMAFSSGKVDVFGIIGGSPCPDFSATGSNEGVVGERGKLTQVFVNMICAIRPAFFIMENVPGLYRQRKHRPYLEHMLAQFSEGSDGYRVDFKILNALEFGVPQERERLFLIGFQKKYLARTSNSSALPNNGNWFPWPEPPFPHAKGLEWPTTSPFRSRKVPKPDSIPIDLTVYPLLSGDVESLPNGNETFAAYSPKFWQIAEGDVSGKSFKRLHRYRYSPTAWYGNNEVHIHPWEPRRLSVREALRVQTVPDEYVIPSEFTLTDKFKMIANGVPCRLAEQVACSVRSFISNGFGNQEMPRADS
ncbi:DNA (cytosine-5)-methyltransferase 1 [Anaerolineae bacterium]|nr:DNA (cytosine-5)-methyltransferase 1 [Anaerolineae bacterium]